jgi:hypothetical protein
MDKRGVRSSSLSHALQAKRILEQVQKERKKQYGTFQSLTQLMVEAIYNYYGETEKKGKHARED